MFKLFGIYHILIILLPIVSSIVLIYLTRKTKREKTFKIGATISWIALIILIIRSIGYIFKGIVDYPDEPFYISMFEQLIYILPFQICHLANIIFFYAYKKNNNILFALGYTINLPAALLALVFAGDLKSMIEGNESFRVLNVLIYIVGHSLLVVMPLFSLYHKHFTLDVKVVIKSTKFLLFGFLFFLIFNNMFNFVFKYLLGNFASANYFFTLYGQGGFPLENFSDLGESIWSLKNKWGWLTFNPIYILLSAILVIVIIIIFYFIYLGLTKLFDKIRYKEEITVPNN